MKQVLQNLSSGETCVEDVPTPSCSSQRLLIRSSATLISAGTEKMLVEFGKAGLIGKVKAQPEKVAQVLDKIRTDGLMPTLDAVFSKLGEPLPLGYCNTGTIVEVGNKIAGFEEGDRVVSNGPHAELVSVPNLLCAKVPDEVSDEEAAFTVLGSIGLQGLRLAEPTLGETVVVYGLGLIGLVAVQLLRANGCTAIGIDINPARLALAEEFGAIVVNGSQCDNLSAKVAALTHNRGADAVIVTASAKTDQIMSDSAAMCRRRGRVVLVGVVGLNLKRSDFYEKEISFQVSCSYGPGRYDSNYEEKGQDYPLGFVRWTQQRNFEAILSMLASRKVDFSKLITHRFAIEEAPKAYETIQSDPEALGVILQFDGSTAPDKTIRVASSSKPSSSVTAAIIGSGNFTRATMMPVLAKLPIRLKYVAGRSNGAAAQHIASKFIVEHATTDFQRILNDSEVNVGFVTTNHDSHAMIATQLLQAGKHVFVEKPLALDTTSLETLVATAKDHPDLQLMVGFNRRFSPHIEKCRELLQGRSEPIAIQMLMNAGAIPADHWVHDEQIGGGRIVGEACHFIDLASYLTGSQVKSVSAHRIGGSIAVRDDKMAISMEMMDGSIASINYFANGSKSYPKESIEIFSDERILKVDNFRVTQAYGFRQFKKLRTSRQEKGHREQFSGFVNLLSSGGMPLISLDSLINTTLASFAAVASGRERRTVNLSDEYSSSLSHSS